jgi:2-haloacid dehalogenase
MKYHNILFDLDNTLLDFDQSSRLAWTDVMTHYGLPSSQEHYELYHEINQRLWSTLETGGLHQDEIKHRRWEDYFSAIDTYRDPAESNQLYFDGLANHVIKITGADDLLHELAHKKVGIVTNGIGVVQRRRLASTGWLDIVPHLIISDEIGVAKPHRAYFDHTFEVMSIPSDQKAATIIVGDTLKSDIKGGIDYGIHTCWHNYGGKVRRGPYVPTVTVDSLGELLDKLV